MIPMRLLLPVPPLSRESEDTSFPNLAYYKLRGKFCQAFFSASIIGYVILSAFCWTFPDTVERLSEWPEGALAQGSGRRSRLPSTPAKEECAWQESNLQRRA